MPDEALPIVLPIDENLTAIGEAADAYTAHSIFSDYQGRRARNTLRRQLDDLQLFCAFLSGAGVSKSADLLFSEPSAWTGMTAGLVKGFVQWQVKRGYSIASVNSRLATIKTYCKLATDASVLSALQLARITLVKGYRHKEGRHLDQERPLSRVGAKKAQWTTLNAGHAELLKRQPTTRIGRRDGLMMCLFLDLGLRCGEMRDLEVRDLDLATGRLTFYREKVDKEQIHQLAPETLIAAMRYVPDGAGSRYLFPGQRDRNTGEERTLDERSINDRVRTLGTRIGLLTLSPHDLRHFWATEAAKHGTDVKSLQEAGGWSSPAMALHYISSSEIANQGIKRGPQPEKG